VTLTLPTRGQLALGAGLTAIRKELTRLLRRASVRRTIRACVGGIEPHLADGHGLWAVHAHLVVDSREADPDFSHMAKLWSTITARRGWFLIPEQGSRVRFLKRTVSYTRKPNDWCPAPGSLPHWALKELFRVTRFRQTGVRWTAPKASCNRRHR
jgi:hypothetical protein